MFVPTKSMRVTVLPGNEYAIATAEFLCSLCARTTDDDVDSDSPDWGSYTYEPEFAFAVPAAEPEPADPVEPLAPIIEPANRRRRDETA